MTSFLYIIKFDTNPATIKIGITNNLKNRIKGLMTGNPVRMKYTYAKGFENRIDAQSNEKFLHKYFKEKNIQGEIFGMEDTEAISKAEELYGPSDTITKIHKSKLVQKNENNVINIKDFKSQYTKKEEIENLYKKLKGEFKDDKFRLNDSEAYKVLPTGIHLYDEIKNPLSEIFYNEPYPISLEAADVARIIAKDNPAIKNTYFSEFLVTVSDTDEWPLRESMKYHKEHEHELHCVGSGDKSKEWNTHRQIRKFRNKIERGPNIMTILDFYKGQLSDLKTDFEYDEYTKRDPKYPNEARYQAPIAFSFGSGQMGETINFWILSDEWLSDAETFGRVSPRFRQPCNKEILSPLCWMFDYYGYAPFVHTVYKPGKEELDKNIPFKIKFEFFPGYDFDDMPEMYYHCYGMTYEKAAHKADEGDSDWHYKGNWWV